MRTLLILAGEAQGITEVEMLPGDIIKVGSEKSKPVVIRTVLPMPMDETSNGLLVPKYPVDADYVAYLHVDEKIEKKYSSKKRSSKMEKGMARDMKGRQTVGSGAFAFHKGDVSSTIWLGEHKFTDADYYSLTSHTWRKIKEEAWGVGKKPIMQVVVAADTLNVQLFIMDMMDFYDVTEASEDELISLFHFQLLKTSHKSVRLTGNVIKEHMDASRYLGQMPALMLEFDKLQLLAIEPTDFTRIFNND